MIVFIIFVIMYIGSVDCFCIVSALGTGAESDVDVNVTVVSEESGMGMNKMSAV